MGSAAPTGALASSAAHLAPERTAPVPRTLPWSAAGLALVLVAVTAVGGSLTPGFLTSNNLRAILLNTAVTGIVAVSMTPITMSGNFVSLASSQTVMMAAVLFAAMVGAGWNYLLAAAAVLLALSVLGVIEGMVVSAGLNTLVTTLAAGAIIFGAVSGLTRGNDVTFRGHTISWIRSAHFLGLPAPVYFLFGVTIIVSLLMHTTVLGRRIVLTGANSAAAHISGISVRAMTTAAFVIAAAGAALAGVLACSQVGAANVQFLPTLTVNAIAAVLIGGTSVAGGRGSPLRSAVGALIISAIVNLMIMHGLSTGRAEAVEGAILLAVVAVLRVFESGSGR